ncbi:hypothetical protein IYR97_26265 (plasmid) [Pseudomonas fulva]|jgi:hypothetical protein|uniref:Uncharacterized protein n=3 Tax=Pseudomonas TaxID=286 RepID=A0A1X0ZN51_PSEPU|nr:MULTISPECIES: hypothetical protein [Pseudomonas]MCT8162891.1 hypothetical protein [Pseudomonas sp. HD6422]MCT8181340.1 hypothetical protein [Pseudomonas sp. HD6421]MDH1930553.1 hypothetical protein [Pseudomonas sp. GD03696]MDM1711662.1 hypothetical protein [Pseudomonas sp. 165]ORL58697.1 hypothetical protein B7H17_24510 [Pseudomonas putida]
MSCPNQTKPPALHAENEAVVQNLIKQSIISAEDLRGRNRHVLTRLAIGNWGSMTPEAREVLLQHPHHFVRSFAVIGQQDLAKVLSSNLEELSVDQLKLRLQDLARRAAEMVENQEAQASILVPSSPANAAMVSLNVEMATIRARLTNLGHADQPENYVWV